MLRGHAWIWLDEPADAVRLLPGDVAIVVGGRDHHIADEPAPDRCATHEQFWAAVADNDPEDSQAAVFLCGAYRLVGDVGRTLIQALPPMLVIRPSAHDQVHEVVSLVSHELAHPAPGQQTVLNRLLDVLLVLVMRASYQDGSNAPRWYRAAQDPRLSRAPQSITKTRRTALTVPELAHLCAMSRPAFARNFPGDQIQQGQVEVSSTSVIVQSVRAVVINLLRRVCVDRPANLPQCAEAPTPCAPCASGEPPSRGDLSEIRGTLPVGSSRDVEPAPCIKKRSAWLSLVER